MDTQKIHRDLAEDHHPHACVDGVVYLTYTVYDEEIGEEVAAMVRATGGKKTIYSVAGWKAVAA
jgi:hypothetical protein